MRRRFLFAYSYTFFVDFFRRFFGRAPALAAKPRVRAYFVGAGGVACCGVSVETRHALSLPLTPSALRALYAKNVGQNSQSLRRYTLSIYLNNYYT